MLRVQVGDKVRFQYQVGGRTTGIVERIDGEYVWIVVTIGRGRFSIERYRSELKIISSGNRVPWTKDKLKQTLAYAAPETDERKERRRVAQIALGRAWVAGDLVLNGCEYELPK